MAVHVSILNLNEDLDRSLSELRRDRSRVIASRETVDAALLSDRPCYGVNTGFGALATRPIPPEQLKQLQRNLLLSHAVGVGPKVPKPITALMLRLKLHALGLGYSGVSAETFDRMLMHDQMGLIPVVPSRGSVCASGDLAPLAHLSLPLIGHGEFWDEAGQGTLPAALVMENMGLHPIELAPKDGLALINGTEFTSAHGAYVLEKCQRLVKLADLIGAMSLEALQGSIKPFDSRVHAVRPHPGQLAVAANVRMLLVDSEILEAHRDCGKVQDPYCLRCMPQVHGASRDALAYAANVLEIEINSVTDNPLVFPEGDVISGGNFHGEPLAQALDFAAIALAELGSISERRIYLLLEGHDGLPKLLMRETGLNSGFMIPQYTAASLVSENKVLCHPASVDSIPTSLGQEDHVSMGSISALKLQTVFSNVECVLAIECLTAAQALDYRLPLRPGLGVERAHKTVRTLMPHHERDYIFQDELSLMIRLLGNNDLLAAAAGEGPTLQ
jgi:histidine ammonia-lyase